MRQIRRPVLGPDDPRMLVPEIAGQDYEQRRQRQAQGIGKAKEKGVYKGRPADQVKHDRIRELLEKDFSIRKTAEIAGAAPSTVQKVKRKMAASSA